jgi:hypothetical protein
MATVSAFFHAGAARRAAGGDAGQGPGLLVVASAESAVVIRHTGQNGEPPLPLRRSPASLMVPSWSLFTGRWDTNDFGLAVEAVSEAYKKDGLEITVIRRADT